eukprot:COSAG05_NODE_188_length_14697_cov_11.861145_19_plen_334_part_00
MVAAVLVLVVGQGAGLQFKMDANGKQCLSEDAGSDEVLVHARYNVTSKPSPETRVDLMVTSTEDQGIDARKDRKAGEKLHEEAGVSEGTVTFISDASEEFSICFSTSSPINVNAFGQVEITNDIRTGIDAKDYSSAAKKEHLGALELELKKLEDEVSQIMEEMVYMRTREEAMRNTNESTNARVLWFSGEFPPPPHIYPGCPYHIYGASRWNILTPACCSVLGVRAALDVGLADLPLESLLQEEEAHLSSASPAYDSSAVGRNLPSQQRPNRKSWHPHGLNDNPPMRRLRLAPGSSFFVSRSSFPARCSLVLICVRSEQLGLSVYLLQARRFK